MLNQTVQNINKMFSLIAKWTIANGCEKKAWEALKELAVKVKLHEPGTLMYLVYAPNQQESSLPTPSPLEVTFHEVYADKQAFLDHINGPVFTNFVKDYLDLFLTTSVKDASGKDIKSPFVIVDFLSEEAGYIRENMLSK